MYNELNELEINIRKVYYLLNDAFLNPGNDFIKNSILIKFETSLDLFWSLLFKYFNNEGCIVNTTAACLREAIIQNLVEHDPLYFELINFKNFKIKNDFANNTELYYKLYDYIAIMADAADNIKNMLQGNLVAC
ncbi:MAG: hypothetical protein QG635_1068 [Bacteroidota bacterium]|nr:hypothetical protein [Bacteroidota bacterium]